MCDGRAQAQTIHPLDTFCDHNGADPTGSKRVGSTPGSQVQIPPLPLGLILLMYNQQFLSDGAIVARLWAGLLYPPPM